MKAHWQYAKYLWRHKKFVFLGCLRMKVPIWRALTHDWSKFTLAEWPQYVASFYGPQPRTQEVKDAFNRAWLHHIHWNPHHHQHWVLREDSGETKILQMPDTYAREMVADWYGAGKGITGKNDLATWYEKNKDKMLLHCDTRKDVEHYVTMFEGVA